MVTSELPDAITNPTTPCDQQGRQIEDGRWYCVYHGRLKPVRVLVREDPELGELLCKEKGKERWQRVDTMYSDVRWERIEDDEL